MENLPDEVLERFRNGEHVMRHKTGLWNAIWSDMFIETTFMRYGHGPGGLIGLTLNPHALKRWALSLHICSKVLKDLGEMRDIADDHHVTHHKEESPARMASDAADREKLRQKLSSCIDPLATEEHSGKLINIVSGRVSPDSVNVDNALEIGKKQMSEFEQSLPNGFYNTLSKRVVTMSVGRKSVKVGDCEVYDTQMIYARVMGLLSTRELDLKELLSHELSPIPPSMFDDKGDLRIATSKSALKRKLQIIQSTRKSGTADVIIIDGCAVLWSIHWPSSGTVQDFVYSFWSYISQKLNTSDVYLIFDRYRQYSIKDSARISRKASSGQAHKLCLNTPLPAQSVVLSVTENKVQLIDIICNQTIQYASDESKNHTLLITGSHEAPTEVTKGVQIQRTDLRTNHEEADVIIPNQLMYAVSCGCKDITVICDDTDVFVLLLHFYDLKQLDCELHMEGTTAERTIIDIAATAKTHSAIIPQLLAAHALSGCDTVARYNGIGKVKVVQKLLKGYSLTNFGEVNSDFEEVVTEATEFIGACYGQKNLDSMSDVRFSIWLNKMGNKNAKNTPKLQCLPPTTEAFRENVKRAHFQACIWKSALDSSPPNLDTLMFGWTKDEHQKMLIPIAIPSSQSPVPTSVLQMIRCGCSSNLPCATNKCGCFSAQLSCTVFCKCFRTGNCQSRWTKETGNCSGVEDACNTDNDDENDE
ncbi:hypothetical protein FSP39_022295 [Pinctada imbricata]|uniref:Tesmin/TSO1-like CXC domain-containing protein n=1 Tax=Pinctada imbricata TaxID=66713 RepID=A0AA88YJ35_PINIB|nr:hypothetical protein FSP39_022295 [Pinctada imbricata]